MKIDDHLIVMQQRTAASVSLPDSGNYVLFFDSANGALSKKDNSGTVVNVGGITYSQVLSATFAQTG